MFDDLESLLKSAKKEAYTRKATKPPSVKVEIRRQADLEWTVGQTVCLIHKAPDGTETALGLFTEYLRKGSRWLRPTSETLSPHHAEIVTGSWWLCPSIREIPLDTSQEVKAIRARFEMLMDEFEAMFPEFRMAPERPLDDDEDFDEDFDDNDEEDLDFDDEEGEE